MTAADVGQRNRSAHGVSMNMGIVDLASFKRCAVAAKSNVSVQMLCANTAAGDLRRHRGAVRHLDLVIDLAFVVVGFVEKVSADFNAVTGLAAIRFYLVGMRSRHDDH